MCPLPTLLCRCPSSLSAFPTLGDAQPLETLLQAATIETARESITTYAERFTSCMRTALATSEQGALIGHQLFGACLPAQSRSAILRWSAPACCGPCATSEICSGESAYHSKSCRVIVCCLPPAQPAESPTACHSCANCLSCAGEKARLSALEHVRGHKASLEKLLAQTSELQAQVQHQVLHWFPSPA